MNRLFREIHKRLYTTEHGRRFDKFTPQERKDWEDLVMFDNIVRAVRYQRNTEGRE